MYLKQYNNELNWFILHLCDFESNKLLCYLVMDLKKLFRDLIHVSKECTSTFYVFRQCTYICIVYLYAKTKYTNVNINFQEKLELWVTSPSDTPRLQYYDVQTLEYRYISKLPMKNEWIWSYVNETTSHLQNKLTKNIHLGVATNTWPPFRESISWIISPSKF